VRERPRSVVATALFFPIFENLLSAIWASLTHDGSANADIVRLLAAAITLPLFFVGGRRHALELALRRVKARL
jgi:hypothetical protein